MVLVVEARVLTMGNLALGCLVTVHPRPVQIATGLHEFELCSKLVKGY